MHRLKMNYLGRKLHFVVMQSVFEGDQAIHETYDLKVTPTPTCAPRALAQSRVCGCRALTRLLWRLRVGGQGSTHGRAATEKEKARGPAKCVFKDLDMLERVERLGKLKFGGDRSKFLQQIERDVAVRRFCAMAVGAAELTHTRILLSRVQFLERMKIMDYSLLIGIHYKSRSRETGLRRRSVQLSPDAKWDHMAQLRALREMHAKNQVRMPHALCCSYQRPASRRALRRDVVLLPQLKDVGETDEGTDEDPDARPGSRRGSRSGGPLRPTASVPAMVRSPHKRGGSRDIFTRADDLCIKGNNPDGSYCDEVYHMGEFVVCVCRRVRTTHSRVVACVSRHHRHPAAVRYEEKPGNHLQELCDEEEHDLFRESDAVRRPVQGVHGPNHRIAVNSNNFNILNTHVSRTLQAERERCLHIFGCEPFSTAALLCTPQSSKPRVELCLGRAVTHGTQTARRSLGI